jgi:LDH2 family malate/lactate/ureidoglycolate dehydrogenase
MAPADGGKPVLGTNPIAISAPAVDGLTPLLDMATSNVAYGKLIVAANSGTPIPLGWAVDCDGQPTTDPQAGLDGALLPLGGPKGFGLAFMIDVLCALGDANVSPDVHPLYGERSTPQRLGFSTIAINPEPLAGTALLTSRLTRLVDAVHGAARDVDASAMIPGEPEQRHERDSIKSASLADETLAELQVLASTYELPLEATVEEPEGHLPQ